MCLEALRNLFCGGHWRNKANDLQSRLSHCSVKREECELKNIELENIIGELEGHKIPVPQTSGEIDHNLLSTTLEAALGEKTHQYLSDNIYKLIPKSEMVRFLKEDKTDLLKYVSEYYDCLLPNSPLICKIDDEIRIVEVQELPEAPLNSYILDKNLDDGQIQWTKINWAKKKDSKKDVIIINNPDGFLELTEDHRVHRAERWYRIGELQESKQFKRSKITTINEWDGIFSENDFDEELAYAYGVFLAEGHAGHHQTKTTRNGWSWHMDMGERDILERVQVALEKDTGIKLDIMLYPSQRKGSVRGGITSKKDLFRLLPRDSYGKGRIIAEEFIEKFYTNSKDKKIPIGILNANRAAKLLFLTGFIDGDGSLMKNKRVVYQAACKSRSVALGLCILAEQIGWSYSVSYDKRAYENRQPCPMILFYPDGIKKTNEYITKENGGKPRSLHYANQFNRREHAGEVYDINTESGHFFAGKFLVHNCDDFSFRLMGNISVPGWSEIAFGIIWGDVDQGPHGFNCFVDDTMKVWAIEPQTDAIIEVRDSWNLWLVMM